MRLISCAVVVVVAAGCGGKVRPLAPVLSGWERVQGFALEEGSTAQYSGSPIVAAPVLPFMAFGAAFDLDLIVATKGDWSMHEFVRTTLPGGKVRWGVLATRADTGDQVLLAEHESIDLMYPEIAIDRHATKIDVTDESTAEEIRVTVRFENMDRLPVEANFVAKAFSTHEKRRNGQTMGHSRNQLLAGLDISHSESAFDANIKVDGKALSITRVGGILPFQFVAMQAQGGLSIGSYQIDGGEAVNWDRSGGPELLADPDAPVAAPEAAPVEAVPATTGETVTRPPDESLPESTGNTVRRAEEPVPAAAAVAPDGLPVEVDTAPVVEVPMAPLADFTTTHLMASGNRVLQHWDVDVVGNRVFATTASPERIIRYEFLANVDAIELSSIQVEQYGRAVPVSSIEFSPALPDYRRSFGGHHKSQFVVDVNGQASNITGTVESWWTESGLKVKVEPTEPEDAVTRQLVSTILVGDGKATVQTERVE